VQRRDDRWLRLLAAAAGTFVREGLRVCAKDDGNDNGKSVHERPAAGRGRLIGELVPSCLAESYVKCCSIVERAIAVFRNRLPRND
jgi:hypothetical protein